MAGNAQQPIFRVSKSRAKDALDLSIRFSADQAKWVGSVVGGGAQSKRAAAKPSDKKAGRKKSK